MHEGVDNSFSLLCLKMLQRMCEWWKNLQPKCWSGVCQEFALLFKVIWERRLHAQTRLWLITAKLMQFQALRWFIATISSRVCLFPFSQRNRILKVDRKKLIKLISVTRFSVLLFNCCAWNGSCQIYYLLVCGMFCTAAQRKGLSSKAELNTFVKVTAVVTTVMLQIKVF